MKKGICKNYNNCDFALADKVIIIKNKEDIYCSECGNLLEIIEKKNKKKIKFRWRKAKRFGVCRNETNCNLAIKDKVIKIYTKEDTHCTECGSILEIEKIENKPRHWLISIFKNMLYLFIALVLYNIVTSDFIDIQQETFNYKQKYNKTELTIHEYRKLFAKKFRQINPEILENLEEKEKVILCNKISNNITLREFKSLLVDYSNSFEKNDKLTYQDKIKECNPNKIKVNNF